MKGGPIRVSGRYHTAKLREQIGGVPLLLEGADEAPSKICASGSFLSTQIFGGATQDYPASNQQIIFERGRIINHQPPKRTQHPAALLSRAAGLPRVYRFADSLALSERHFDADWWLPIYRRAFPRLASAVSVRDDGWAQRGGIDRILTLECGRTFTVDEKVRMEN